MLYIKHKHMDGIRSNRFLLCFVLNILVFFGMTDVLSSQRVYITSSPDAGKIIHDQKIMEEFYFDADTIDSMKQAFYSVPGASTFAVKKQLSFNPANSGEIIINEKGERVWYLRLRSPNAKSLNVIFKKFIPLKERNSLFTILAW